MSRPVETAVWSLPPRAQLARIAGATALSVGAIAALAPWAPAAGVLLAIAAPHFILWRDRTGAVVGFSFMVAAALVSWSETPRAALPEVGSLVVVFGALVIFGFATIFATARFAERGRPGHRLVSAFLAAIGIVAVGISLATNGQTASAGSALVAGGTAFLLGAVPSYAWAPLLIRHDRRAASILGVMAFIATAVVALWVPSVLPDPAAARLTYGVLGAVTGPWAAWHAIRQRGVDDRCARSFFAAAGGAVLLMLRDWWLSYF